MTRQHDTVDALVTGATGFIGNHLLHALLKSGRTVRVLVREGKKCDRLEGLPIETVYGCLEDPDVVRDAAAGVRTIYNCAGLSSDWAAWKKFHDANVAGVKNLLEALEFSGAHRLVHLSTSDVYGYPNMACSEEAGIRDVGLPYNRSKVEGEKLIWNAVKERHLPVTVFRPATVYGPGSMEWVVEIGKLMLKNDMVLLNGGKSRAGLVYVDNLTRIMMMAAESPVASGKSYNIRDVGNETWKDFVDGLGRCFVEGSWGCSTLPAPVAYGVGCLMEGIYGIFGIKARPLLTRHAVNLLSKDQGFDITRVQSELGFDSWVSFEQGMALTREWMRSEEGRECLIGRDQTGRAVYA
ncbi:MAG: NAD-dependent epimerase/dehydratase family protein [Gammaproteobacteria bacterium]